ncbi:MAG: membrane protein insertase YidC [Solirubrobacteraceae bacterium]|jgi:YidC/Oxa1 family membrane protein insertase
MILANIIQSAFGPLIAVFKAVLVEAHTVLGGSWGWSIIGLTIVIRLVTLPLMIRQFRSMAVMQAHAPELKALQQRYKDDRQRQSEEMMKYYKEHGVNPFASCLPLLIQLPVLISLFYMLRTDLKQKICGPQIKAAAISAKKLANIGCSSLPGAHNSASFLFIHDITIKATGVTLVVLIGLYLLTMLTTSYFSTVNVDRSQRIMYMVLPLVFTVIIIRYPAGLLLYWTTSNMTQIPLQWYARRQVRPVTLPTPPATNGRAPSSSARRAIDTSKPVRSTPPPQSPRKRKKRSGRRR